MNDTVMTDQDTDGEGLAGLAVYALFVLGSVVVGPLEAVLALALYWLVDTGEADG